MSTTERDARFCRDETERLVCKRCGVDFPSDDWSPCHTHGLCADCHSRAEWADHDEDR